MKLTRNKGMALATFAIILTVFNVIAFVIPFVKSGSFWVGYGFSTLALILSAAVSYYAFDRESLTSKVYGIPLIAVSWRYLIIQLIVGLIEMSVFVIPFRYAIVLNVILLGACLIGLVTVDVVREEMIAGIDDNIKEKVFYIKSLQVDVEVLRDKVSDESMKKTLKELAETIRYSDPMSSPQLAEIENKIEVKAAILSEHIEKANLGAANTVCTELQQLFSERNRKCKILK